jgi:hypothetical protein
MAEGESMREYAFYWRDGTKNIGTGSLPSDALRRLGFGAGAISALDFWSEDKDYEWSAERRDWVKIQPRGSR